MKAWKEYKEKSYDKAILQYIINLVMLLVFWGGLLRKSYNYDTLYHMVADDADIVTRIRGGRYVAALIDYLLFKFGMRTTDNISLAMFITLILLAAAMYNIQALFKRWMPDKPWERAGFLCGLNLVFLNVLFAEPLMFGEYSIYFAIAYLAAAVGVRCFVSRRYVLMLVMYAVAVSSYQNAVTFAAILTAFYICLDEKLVLSLRAVLREAAGIIICMLMGAVDLLSIRVLEKLNLIPLSGKVSGTGNIIKKLYEAAGNFIALNKSADGIMSNLCFPLIFTVIIGILIIYACVKEHKLKEALFLLIVWLGSNVLIYVIPVVSMEFYCPPRLSFNFFLVQGLMLVSAYAVCRDSLHMALSGVGAFYLILHLLFSGFIIEDHFVSNSLDEAYINMIDHKIAKYEDETGIRVTKLAVMKDTYSPSFYEQVSYVSGQINERSLDAVPTTIIKIMTDRELQKIEMPKEIRDKYFKDKDWDYFNVEEQLVIEGDTAYWCIF